MLGRLAIGTLAIGTLVAIGLFSSANAAPISGATSLQSIVGSAEIVHKVACWRHGWRGWGVYPGCFPSPVYAPPPYAVPLPYYAPAPVYVAPPVYVRPPRRCWINGAWRVC